MYEALINIGRKSEEKKERAFICRSAAVDVTVLLFEPTAVLHCCHLLI